MNEVILGLIEWLAILAVVYGLSSDLVNRAVIGYMERHL